MSHLRLQMFLVITISDWHVPCDKISLLTELGLTNSECSPSSRDPQLLSETKYYFQPFNIKILFSQIQFSQHEMCQKFQKCWYWIRPYLTLLVTGYQNDRVSRGGAYFAPPSKTAIDGLFGTDQSLDSFISMWMAILNFETSQKPLRASCTASWKFVPRKRGNFHFATKTDFQWLDMMCKA